MINLNLNKVYSLIFNKSDDKKESKTKLNLKHDQVNNLVASDIRKETFDNKEFHVYPVVMIKHTVVNGSLVELDDLIAESWNGVPVTVAHPTMNGENVSANHPEVLTKFEVGRIFNASIDGDKLKAEVWIDVEKANSKFPELLSQMQTTDMEVSTGYFALDVPNMGSFDNKAHKNQHKDIKPDHLALLPDDVGACSFEDGCGIRANGLQAIFNKAMDKIKGNDQKEVVEIVVNSLKALQADIEEILKEGKTNMTEKVKTNCEGLSQEEKEDLAFLRNQIKTQKAGLVTQAAKKLGVEEDTLESWSLEQLDTVVNSKAKEIKETDETTKETKTNKEDSKKKDYSGRPNAKNKTETDEDYSDMVPFTMQSLVKKDQK